MTLTTVGQHGEYRHDEVKQKNFQGQQNDAQGDADHVINPPKRSPKIESLVEKPCDARSEHVERKGKEQDVQARRQKPRLLVAAGELRKKKLGIRELRPAVQTERTQDERDQNQRCEERPDPFGPPQIPTRHPRCDPAKRRHLSPNGQGDALPIILHERIESTGFQQVIERRGVATDQK